MDAYIMRDLNVDLLRLDAHGPTSDYLGEFASEGFYPLISFPTRHHCNIDREYLNQ